MRPLRVTYEIGLKEMSALIRKERDVRIRQRLAAMKLLLQGVHVPEAAARIGVSERPLRKWVHRFNEDGPTGLCDALRSGRPPKLKRKHVEKFKKRMRKGTGSKDSTCSLKGSDLQRILKREFRAGYSLSGTYFVVRRIGV